MLVGRYYSGTIDTCILRIFITMAGNYTTVSIGNLDNLTKIKITIKMSYKNKFRDFFKFFVLLIF